MKRISVALFSPAWRGGEGWFVQQLAQGIAEAGANLWFVSPTADPIERDPRHENLKRIRLPQGTGGRGSRLYRLVYAVWRIFVTFPLIAWARMRSSVFLVTLPDWTLLGAVQLAWIRLLGAKVIYIVHDPKPHSWRFSNSPGTLDKKALEFTYWSPDHLVAATQAARDTLIRDFRVPSEKISVISIGALAPKVSGEISGNTRLLMFGMLRRNKCILETIQAMALLPKSSRAKLVIAGSPAEEMAYWQECKLALAECGTAVETDIGFLPEARVAELLSDCDALILPYEEFDSQSGVAILGCLAGRSLICTDAGGIRELIETGLECTLIQRPVSAESIADAIVRYEEIPMEERRAQVRKSRMKIEYFISWSRIGRAYVDLVEHGIRARS